MSNVVAFAPRRAAEPGLEFVEFVLDEDGFCGLRISLADEGGNIIALEYKLTDVTPSDFDLDRLRAKWVSWCGSTGMAS